MEYFLQQLINGVTLGSIYGLIAIGYTMVYGIIGMINFAHGDIFMVSTMISLVILVALLSHRHHLGPGYPPHPPHRQPLLTSLYGWTVERMAYRPLRGSFRLAPLISAIGMSIVLQNYVQNAQGADKKAFPSLIPGYMSSSRRPTSR